jgi:hypothetical protein
MKLMREIPRTKEIYQFFHCKSCALDCPTTMTWREWVCVEVGFTPIGLQVWCKRCEMSVIHFDFEGHEHSAR